MENSKEAYINYLVRKVADGVSNEISILFDEKMSNLKKEFYAIDYKTNLVRTEEILKKYNKLKKHVELSKFSKDEIKAETDEYYNTEMEVLMTEIFAESEIYLKSLLRNQCKTKLFINFIGKVLNNYFEECTEDKIEIRKRKILKEVYLNEVKQSDFILENYETERIFYKDKEKLLKDLAPYFFGINGLEI